MLTEERFAQRLGARLHAAVADVEPPPELVADLNRRYTRRTLAVRVATSLAVATAIVLAVGAVNAGQNPADARLRDVGYVRTQTLDALANATNYVVHTLTTGSDGWRMDKWLDRSTGAMRADAWVDGTPIYSHAMSALDADGRGTLLLIYHNWGRKWTEFPNVKRPPEGSLNPLPQQQQVNVFDPEGIRGALDGGTLRLLGRERIDGHETLHLQQSSSFGAITAVIDLWVDVKSFLVRRTESTSGERVKGTRTTTYEWLPRTAGNLAHLTLTPPPGYQKY